MSTLRIPKDLDETAITTVLERVNLLATGAKSFGAKEIFASLKWARVPPSEIHRFIDAVAMHGLIREREPVPPRIPARIPLLRDRR
jgi:hypothetical protein